MSFIVNRPARSWLRFERGRRSTAARWRYTRAQLRTDQPEGERYAAAEPPTRHTQPSPTWPPPRSLRHPRRAVGAGLAAAAGSGQLPGCCRSQRRGQRRAGDRGPGAGAKPGRSVMDELDRDLVGWRRSRPVSVTSPRCW